MYLISLIILLLIPVLGPYILYDFIQNRYIRSLISHHHRLLKYANFVSGHIMFIGYILLTISSFFALDSMQLLNIATMVLVILFVVWLSFIVHILHESYKLGNKVFVAVIIVFFILFIFISGSSKDLSSLSNSSKNSFFRLSLSYLFTLMIPFGILLHNDVYKRIMTHKKAFYHRNDADIYDAPVLELISLIGVIVTLSVTVFSSGIFSMSLIYIFSAIYMISPLGLIAIDEQIELKVNNRIQFINKYRISWEIEPNQYCITQLNNNPNKFIGYIINNLGSNAKATVSLISLDTGIITSNYKHPLMDGGISFEGASTLDKQYALFGGGINKAIITNHEFYKLFCIKNPGKYYCVLTFIIDNDEETAKTLNFDYNLGMNENESYIIRFYSKR